MIRGSGSPHAATHHSSARRLLVACAALVLVLALPAAAHAATVSVGTPSDVVNGNTSSVAALTGPGGDGGDGICLREAVQACENDGGANTILVPNGTYALSGGEMLIGTKAGSNLTVEGGGSTVLQPSTQNRVFKIDPNMTGNATVLLTQLTFRQGRTPVDDADGGGAVLAYGMASSLDRVTVDWCSFESNSAAGSMLGGGAIAAWDNTNLTVRNSTFTGNSAPNQYGGAIFFFDILGGQVQVTDSVFTNNTATGAGQGGALYLATGTSAGQQVLGCTFTGNAASQGGAIFGGPTGAGSLLIQQNRIVGNSASASGQGLYAWRAGVNAARNWWGSNGGPGAAGSDTAAGSAAFTITPPLVLRVRSAATTVTRNAATSVEASITYDASGGGGYPVPGAPAVTWAAGVGTMSPTNGSLAVGVAGSTFTAAAVGGPGWASARVDNQTVTATIDVPEPPHVTADPVGVTKLAGQVASFSVGRSGYPTPTVQWQRSTNGGVVFADVSLATSTTYSFTTTATDWGYQYRAVLTNVADVATSTAAVLTVNTTPTVVAHPLDATVTVGDLATFVASGEGTPTPTVRWQQSGDGGATFSDIGGATSPSYSLTAAKADYGALFRAVFSNAIGDATTTPAVLRVVEPPAMAALPDVTFHAGVHGVLAIAASGSPTVTLTCAGTRPGSVSFTDNGDGSASLEGTPSAASRGSYPLSVTASNGVEPPVTRSFTLTVDDPPLVTLQPVSRTVPESATAQFVAHASSSLATTVRWETKLNWWEDWTTVPMANLDTLTVTPGYDDNGRSYRAVFTNADGVRATDEVVLSVDARWGQHPRDKVLNEGTNGGFLVQAEGSVPGIGWEESADNGATWLPASTGGAGFSGPPFLLGTLGWNPVDRSVNGMMYRARIDSIFGTTWSRPARLTVQWPAVIGSAAETTFTIGVPGSFTVTSAANPTATLSIPSGALPGGVTFVDSGDGTATLGGTPTAGGVYSFTISATNPAGTTNQSFRLVVRQQPAFTSASSALFRAGSAGSFAVHATGTPAPAITIESGSLPAGLAFADSGDGTATISGTPGTRSGGVYPLVLRARNELAEPTSALTLTVEETAAILTQPADLAVLDNQVATFTASGYGYPAPTVRWQTAMDVGGPWTDVPGATTDTLTLTATGADNGRLFRAVYTNSLGEAASAAAKLTVHTAPAVTWEPGDATVAEGAGLQFNAVVSSTIPLGSYGLVGKTSQWRWSTNGGSTWNTGEPPGYNGEQYPNAITLWTAQLRLIANRSMNGTLYRAAVKNAAGESLSRAAKLTVTWAPEIKTAAETTFTVGAAGSFTVTTTANPTATVSITSGSLPGGVGLVDNGDGTALLSGTPAAGSGGDWPITIRAANTGGNGTQSFVLHVVEAPTVLGANASIVVTEGLVPDGVWAVFRSAPAPLVTWEVSGDDGATWGAPPAGWTPWLGPWMAAPTYQANLQYTPAADRTMNGMLVRARITNGLTTTTTAGCALDVRYPASITSANGATFRPGGTANAFTVTTSGNPTAALSIEGALPPGVTFTAHEGTAAIAGDPAAMSGGSYEVTITARNGVGAEATQKFTLTVVEPAAFTSSNATTFTVGATGSFSVTTTGYPIPTLAPPLGALPTGVTFVPQGDGTALLSGTPAAGTAGVYALTFSASNGILPLSLTSIRPSNVPGTQQSFTLTVILAPAVTDNPWDAMVRTGDTAFFGAGASGYPAPAVRWQVSTDGGESFTDIPGETAESLSFTAAAADDGKRYRAVFTNDAGEAFSDSALLRVDDAPPVTTFSGPDGVWQAGDTTYTLSAADDVAGVRQIHWRHDGGETSSYPDLLLKALRPNTPAPPVASVTVTVTKEGTTTVEYWSDDFFDRVESTKTAHILIDRIAPVLSTDAGSAYAGAARIAFSAEDTGSGLASVRYSLDGASPVTAGFVDVVTNGAHTLVVTAEDRIGHKASVTETFTLGTDFIPIAGADRYGTAIAASKAAFASGADSVIVATGLNWPDAIAGSSLAGARDCPLLLTRPGALTPEVAAEIKRLGAKRAYVLGGPAAIGMGVENDLTAMLGMGNVVRIGGSDRYETAALIGKATLEALAAAGKSYDGVAFVGSGENFPDALAAAPVAWYRTRPILLSRVATMPPSSQDALRSLGVTQAVILGGEGAVGRPVADMLSTRFAGRVMRLGGSDRYSTAALIADYGVTQGLEWDGVALATGRLFPDALAGGVMQGKFRSVVLLTPGTSLAPAAQLALHAHRAEIAHLRFLGGPAAVSEKVRVEAVDAISK